MRLEDNLYWIWLSAIKGLSANKCLQLINHFGSIEEVWKAKEDELKRVPFITKVQICKLQDHVYRESSKRILDQMVKKQIKMMTIKDALYPHYLRTIHNPPIVLYVKGGLLKDEKTVAVVGSRNATPYGLKMAEVISQELGQYGITVVSGMARGVDSYAHKGALSTGSRTIAVLGCGLDIVYPYENRDLMDRIIESGAVLSEYVPGTPPVSQNFPARNRIISGISYGVVVVEANEQSGSLITANFALEQGREVFAVPGNVNSSNSIGSNKLIREGAKIFTEIEDILEELCFQCNKMNKKVIKSSDVRMNTIIKALDDEEKEIYHSLILAPLHIDDIAKTSGLCMSVLNAALIIMELKGLIEPLPGKVFKLRE